MRIFKWLSPLLNVDGDIGAVANSDAPEPSSVETGNEPDLGTASESATESTPDVTQQKAFAERLKEQTSKLEEKYKPFQQHSEQLQGIAQTLGFKSVDEYLSAVNEQLKDRQAAEEAKRLGVSEDQYKQFFAPVKDDLSATKQELQQLRQAEFERKVQAERDALAAQHPDFVEVEEQVWQIATDRRIPLADAYKLATYDSRIAAVRTEAEQQVLANVTGREQNQVLSSKDKGGSAAIDPANMSLADILAVSARVQSGETIKF